MRLVFQALGILLVGMLVRYRQGPSMFDPFFFIPFSCLSVILVGPILTEQRSNGVIDTVLSRGISTVTLTAAAALAVISTGLLLILAHLSPPLSQAQAAGNKI